MASKTIDYESPTKNSHVYITIDMSPKTITGSTFTVSRPAWKVRASVLDDLSTSGLSRQYGFQTSALSAFIDAGGETLTNVASFANSVTNTVSGSSTQATLAAADSGTLNTSTFFNATNPTEATKKFYLAATGIDIKTAKDSSFVRLSPNITTALSWLKTGWINATYTLNVPPVVATPTVSKDTTEWVTGLTTMSVSVPITYDADATTNTGTAKYGGYVKSITLTLGSQTKTLTFTESTKPTTAQTLTLVPTVADTFDPTITVTDSRGQTTTVPLPQITVNQYTAPSLDFDVFRTDSSGVRADEGAYGLITANISFTDAVADITEPTVQINGTETNNVTWYTALLNTGEVDPSAEIDGVNTTWGDVDSGDTIYGLINGSFSPLYSYQITVTLTDSLGAVSSAITQTLSTAYYTIDFKAGGKEIAFGGPAKDDLTNYPNGLFKCEMDIIGRGFLDYFYPVGSYYETSDVTFNPNTKWGGTWVLETEGQVHISGSVSGTYQISGAPTDTNDGGATDAIIPYHNHGFTQPTISSHTHPAAEGKGFLEYNGNITITSKRAYTAANSSGVIYIVASDNPGITRNTTTGTRQPTASGGAVQYAGTNGNRTNANMQPYIIVNRWHRTA